MDRHTFISTILNEVLAEAPKRDIHFVSPIIAQACLESRFGESEIMAKNHNYFGMKCSKAWKGAAFNAKTKEEYTPGQITNITAMFRSYPSLHDGIVGYFDFISTPRYSNLKGATSADDYCERIKADGWATSSTYVTSLKKIMDEYNLREYDKLIGQVETGATVISNNQAVSTPMPTYKPVTKELVDAVIRGQYGNGATRKNRLEHEGYSYSAVQAEVNKRYGLH